MTRSRLSDEWLTPLYILDAVGGAGSFDLDPATPMVQPYPTARRRYHRGDNGLLLPWFGRIWLNPPYSYPAITKFLGRMAAHNRGIALIFARTDTETWRDHVFGAASGFFWLLGRVNFNNLDGTPAANDGGAPSVLCAYGARDLDVLAACDLPGEFDPRIVPRFWLGLAARESWREVIAQAVAAFPPGPVSIADLYRAVALHPKARRNNHVRAKIRQQLQKGPYRRVARALWEAA